MPDDDERRRLDETGEYFPFAGEAENPPIGGPSKDDHPHPVSSITPEPERTQVVPSVTPEPQTQLIAAADDNATQVDSRPPRGDATSVLPALPSDGTRTDSHNRSTDNWADDGDPVWSARASVRPRYRADAMSTDWAAEPADEPHGRWWTPIAVGIIALLLLSLLGWGIYLIARASGGTDPAVAPSAAAPATAGATAKGAGAPPSTAPTTQATTPPPTTPSDVTVPALKGLSSEEARGALDRKGLNYRLRFVTSEYPGGTVIDSDPAEGQQVPADTVITLIIAAERTASPTPTQSTITGQAGNQDEN